MSTLFTINPSRRKKRRAGKKRRSAKQRAATRRMLAARFGHNPKRRKSRRKARRTGVARASKRRSVSRRRRGGRGRSMRLTSGNAMNLLQQGAIGGAGALLIDVGMGQAQRFLPAALATPVSAEGGVNFGYFAAKGGLALLLGTMGGRIMPSAIAEKMGEGALTVLAYQLMRPFVPAALALGSYFNPAPTMRPQSIRGAGAYVAGAGAYPQIPVRNSMSNNRGSRASNVLNMVNVARRAA